MDYRAGIDIGGTFTDFALFNDATGEVWTHKQLTTPHDPSIAVIEGTARLLQDAGVPIADVATIAHGTTLVTNAVIERKGASVAMVVTRGFADVLDIAYERRYDLFDLRLGFPTPVVPRNLRFEVDERRAYDGAVLRPLADLAALQDRLATAIAQQKVEAVAICLLHSYVNAGHEEEIARWLRETFPGLHVSTSASVFPFMREYERWTTTCLNAYVQPVVDRYLSLIESGLERLGFHGKFFIMSSSGSTLAPALARRFPVRMLESGPAAGALMSARHGRTLGEMQVLSFDMGGTTAKGCIIKGGAPLKTYQIEVAHVHEFKKGSGFPVKIPVIDMIEIGSGGGSLAEIDARGVLRVGPRSAGANPGPVCYGLGGERPTLTDANLILGYLGASSFLGGRMRLNFDGAAAAMGRHVGQATGMDALHAAWGVYDMVCEDVARAFRVHASERGVDYRNCSMIAFGGSGPVLGSRVAHKLKIPRVICPWGAGVMSAFGLLSSPQGFELVRSDRTSLASLAEDTFCEALRKLAAEASAYLEASGAKPGELTHRFALDMRYEGQGYEVEVRLPPGTQLGAAYRSLPESFAAAYQEVFGLSFTGRPVEIVNWKVEAEGPVPGRRAAYHLKHSSRAAAGASKGARAAYFPELGIVQACPVYDRYALVAGDTVDGPALVEENESTCVLLPGDRAVIDRQLNLAIELGAPS